MSPKKNAASPEARAEEVLRRGKRVRAQELVSLIHEINPTGRELAPEVDRRRYALKSKLQSLLVREFPEELTVEPLGESGVVGLRYRPQDRDACHAVIGELDEDARSWVRLALDVRDMQPAVPRPVGSAADKKKEPRSTKPALAAQDPASLLRLASEALEAYDFERARECFDQAFEDSDGEVAPASALLEFLVDNVAAYHEALECQSRLSPEALRDPTVRSLLAAAAAQLGQLDRCVGLLNGVEGRRAVDAWVFAARTALASGDLGQSEACAGQARKLEPAHPEVLSLVDELTKKRAVARQPVEAELEQLAAGGDDGAVETKVRQILVQWPDSGAARRILREIETRQRAAQAAELCLDGGKAFEAGEFTRAARLWSEAQALGAAGLAQRIAAAVAADEGLHREERIATTARALAGGLNQTRLAQYQDLAAPEREQVRSRLRLPALEWLELLGPGSDERERSTDVAAALALLEASALSIPEKELQIIAVLEPFEERLRRLAPGFELLSRARTSRDERELDSARRSLLEARRAFEDGRHEVATRLAEQLRVSGPGELRAEAAQLETEARKPLELQRRRDDYQGLLRANRLTDALDLIREAELDGSSEEQPHWNQCRQGLAQRLRREFNVQVHDCSTPATAPECGPVRSVRDDIVFGLDGSAETFYWVTSSGRELFVRVLAVREQRIRTLVALRSPEPLDFPRAQVEGGSLWISGASGAVLELSTSDWSVLRWRSSAGLYEEGEVVEQELLVPGTRFLWLSVRARGRGEEVLRVFDLERRRLVREMTGGTRLTLVPAPGGPRVFARGFRRGGRLYLPGGNATIAIPSSVGDVACAPAQAGYFGFTTAGDEDAEVLQLVLLDGKGTLTATAELPDSWSESSHGLATSHSSRLTFALYDGDASRLVAFEAAEGALREVWQVQAPPGAWLATDVGGEQVALWYPSSPGPALELLGRLPPKLALAEKDVDPAVPLISDNDYCGTPPFDEGLEKEVRAIKEQASAVARARALDESVKSRGEEPLALVQLAHGLRSWRVEPEASRAASVARSKFPEHPWVRLDKAAESARSHDWAGVLGALAGLQPGDEGPKRAHTHHLRGLALYHQSRFEEARAEFELCAAVPDVPCRVEGWPDWLRALGRPVDGPAGEDAPAALRLLAAIHQADRLLGAGDGSGAQRQLDTNTGWMRLDVQTAARLAEAMLLQPGLSGEQHFRKRLILAVLVDALDERRQFRGELPLGPWSWTEEKLAAIGARARAWLEGDCVRDGEPGR